MELEVDLFVLRTDEVDLGHPVRLKVCYYKPRFSAGDDEPESLQAQLEACPQSLGSPARIGKPPGAYLALREITASHSRQAWPAGSGTAP